jgi:hypothetical protein
MSMTRHELHWHVTAGNFLSNEGNKWNYPGETTLVCIDANKDPFVRYVLEWPIG